MDTLLHILGWILLLTPFIVLFGFIAKMFGLVLVLIMLGGILGWAGFLALAFRLIFY